MAYKYPNLLSPLRVGSTLLRNRIVTPPTGLPSSNHGSQIPEEEAVVSFANRARHGAAMVTCAGPSFLKTEYRGDRDVWDLYDVNSVNALSDLTERIHMYGAKASAELFNASVPMGEYSVCDGIMLPNGQGGKQMPEEEMYRLAQAHADAAVQAKKAGFDCVYLHFGHGWQIAQFLSPLTNTRKDRYGGSLENRARFPMMIIDAVRSAVGRDMLIEMRISGTEMEPGGMTIEEAVEFTAMVQDKIDLVNVSCGLHNTKWFTTTHPCGFLPPMPNVYIAEAFKKSGKLYIPVIAVGGIQDLEAADRIIGEGKADLVAIGRGFIADDELGTKAYQGRGEDIRPCLKCMRCHDSSIMANKYLCSVNPVIGAEHIIPNAFPNQVPSRRVAVVGGGPAGMQAALTAAERGHRVTLYEKGSRLGGKILFSEYVSFKYPLWDYCRYMMRQVEKADIEVRLNTQADPAMLRSLGYDVVIAAVGAEPVVPPFPGVEQTTLATDVYGREGELGQNVVVIGGGQVGCETALHLAKSGKKVVILEMQGRLAPDASPTHRAELMNELEWEKNLIYITGGKCCEITDKGVSYTRVPGVFSGVHTGYAKDETSGIGATNVQLFYDKAKDSMDTDADTRFMLEADDVILAVGMRAKQEESFQFIGSADQFAAVGDCVKARTVENATKEAYYAAMRIF